MSKEDIIYVYFVGGMVTHNLEEVRKEIWRETDYLFSQEKESTKEVNINVNVERVEVGQYMWTNQYNISDEEAECLAKVHNFNLSEIDWDNRDFECMARGYCRK